MFKLLDGRIELYQWDLDRKVIVSDPTIHEVHFCNKNSEHSLITEVYELEGQRVADIPNILLQDIWPIKAYGQCGECYVKAATTFNIVRRAKPDDYVYTETEIFRVEELVAQLVADWEERVIENTSEEVEKAVKEILGSKVDELEEADKNNADAIGALRAEYEDTVEALDDAIYENSTAIAALGKKHTEDKKILDEHLAEYEATVEQVKADAANSLSASTSALAIANNATVAAAQAQALANGAQAAANNAVDAANNAQDTANNALEIVNEAQDVAVEAKEMAENLEMSKLDATHTEWDHIVVNSSSLDRDLRTLSGRVLVKGGSWDGNKQAPINLGENIKHLHFSGTEFLTGALGVMFNGHCEKISGIYTDKSVTFNNIADEVEDCKIGSGYFVNQKVSNIYVSGVAQTIFDGCDYVDNIRGTNIVFMGCTHINPYTCQMGKSGVPMINENATLSWLDTAEGGSYGS